jgi:hypothetical protein
MASARCGGDLDGGRPVRPTAVQLDDVPRGPALGTGNADFVALDPDDVIALLDADEAETLQVEATPGVG